MSNQVAFVSIAEATASSIAVDVKHVDVQFYAPNYGVPSSLSGGGTYVRVSSQPSHQGKFRSTDQFLPDGTTNSTNGGWWALSRDQEITIEQFGAKGNGTDDDLTPFHNALAFLGSDGGELLLRHGPYRMSSTPRVEYPVTIRGASRDVKMIINNSNAKEGLFILHSDVTVCGFTISANASTALTNGSGHCGTCITISEWFVNPDLPQPALVKNIVIRDMTLTRETGSKSAHAIAVMARTSHVLIENIDFIGAGAIPDDGSHGDAVLTHWGAHSHGVSTGALKFDNLTGTAPVPGSTITGSGGATAYLVAVDLDAPGATSGIIYIKKVLGTFANNETITGPGFSIAADGIVFVTALNFLSQSANFSVGQQIKGGDSGATATIAGQIDNGSTGTLFLTAVSGAFQNAEIITSSSGSATTNGTTYSGLRQSRFAPAISDQPPHYSFHPNNVRVRNCRLRNTGRLIACSASYSIDIDGIDYQGPVSGGQLFDLPIGDEGQTFAHPDDFGRVYDGFSMKNVRAKLITGTGANAVTVIDCSGFSTSKQSDADLADYANYSDVHYAGRVQPRRRQFEWKNVLIDGLVWDAGPSTPPSTTPYVRQVWLRNLWGDFTFRNVYAEGRDGVLALTMQNCIGNFLFESCAFLGGSVVDAVNSVKFDKCLMEERSIEVGSSVLFTDGDIRSTVTSGVTAIGATSLSVPAGLPTRYNRGDKLTYSGGVVYVAEYGETGDAVLKVTPLPAASTSGETFFLDHRSDVVVEDCTFTGGTRSIDNNNTLLKVRGGLFRGGGQYGILGNAGDKSSIDINGAIFSNNGLRRARRGLSSIDVTNGGSGYTSAPTVLFTGGGGSGAVGTAILGTGGNAGKIVGVAVTNPGSGYATAPAVSFSGGGGSSAAATAVTDATLATRDVIANAGALAVRACRFEDSKSISVNLVVAAEVQSAELTGNIFSGTPTSKLQVATLTNGKPVLAFGNVDGVGSGVFLSGTWTPVLNIADSGTGITTDTATGSYTVYEDRVFVDFDLTLSSKGSATGAVSIVGLPFAQTGLSVGSMALTAATGLTGTVLTRASGGILRLDQTVATGISSLTNANLTNTTRLRGSIGYQRSA